MPATHIDVATFSRRLADLCTRPRPNLPRKQRDLHLPCKSILLLLDPHSVYSETEINAALSDWLRRIAPQFRIDHVRLRRTLVDHGWLHRTTSGASYTVGPGPPPDQFTFAAAIDRLQPAIIIEARRAEIAKQRADHLRRTKA